MAQPSFQLSKIAVCLSLFSLFTPDMLAEIDLNQTYQLIEQQAGSWFQQLDRSLPLYPQPGSVAAEIDRREALNRQQSDKARKVLAQEDANQHKDHVAMLMRNAALQNFAPSIDNQRYYELSDDLRNLVKRAGYVFDPNKGRSRSYDFILKDKYRRGRPYQVLDKKGEYKPNYVNVKGSSYPSGHTANGFGEAVLASMIFPERGKEIFSRALQYGESRTVLGAHFPTDTIASRFSQYFYKAQLLNNDEIVSHLVQFAKSVREPFDTVCRETEDALRTCLDMLDAPLSTQYEAEDHNIGYYGQIFPERTAQVVLPDNLPDTAGALLRLRFPYLNDNARRQILAADAYPSHSLANLGDFSNAENNWGLINLPASYDGPSYFYGDFATLAEPEHHLDLGNFSQYDRWTKAIQGEGRLIMNHTGILDLVGRNRFAGIIIHQGLVRLAGEHRLAGKSQISENGNLVIAEATPRLGQLSGNGTVIFEPREGFSILTLDNLSGQLNFEINTDLAHQKSDKIVVKGSDNGEFGLIVTDSGNEPQTENGKVTLVETQTGTAQFRLKDREYIDAGAFRYRLYKEDNDWVLSNRNGERVVTLTKPNEAESAQTDMSKPEADIQPTVSTETRPNENTNNKEHLVNQPSETLTVPVENPPKNDVADLGDFENQPIESPITSAISADNSSKDNVGNLAIQPTELPTTSDISTGNLPKENTSSSSNVTHQPTESANNATPSVNTPSITPQVPQVTGGLKELSARTNEGISLRQAQVLHLEQSLSGIHQRLGELKQGERSNVWVRNLNSRHKLGEMQVVPDSRTSGFTQDYHTLQVGADTALNDTLRLGAFAGTARSKIDFKGDYGSGKINSQTLGLYGTFQFNNGLYFDQIAKYERLTSQGQATAKRRYNGYTLSSEVGKVHTLGQGWTVTPQLQLAWSSLSAKENEDRLSAFYARMGVRVTKMLDLNGWTLQPYAEVNGITTKNRHSQVRVNQYVFDVASTRGRVETVLGINAAAGNHRFGVEATTTRGKHLDQPFAVQANYRYSW
ncbi:autotransporter outer membrane beta-barrel domain-containing protein [Muribacter muris]|nr:autotransporter outer membrane beta-barrel domain-containing protein [Muribacter muris]MBF0784877.1 autotransporter outer membrane beta-barrel domain-containing protein [Muribacter muris]MBF0826496.1 autotransporter outer membrane beta-barrel domain-containing protein [Muribacter muris]